METQTQPAKDRPTTVSPGGRSAFCDDLIRLARQLAPHLDTRTITAVPEESVTVPVNMAIRYSVAFDGKTASVKGPLPSNVQAAASKETFRSMLDERLRIARGEAGALIDAWAGQAQDYRREPKPSDFLTERPAFGLQEVCAACSGQTYVTCAQCAGSNYVTCGTCSGRGQITCSTCGGTSQTSCSGCGGRGTVEKVEWMMNAEEKHQTAPQMTQVRQVSCGSCGGSGRFRCSSCSSGSVNCASCATSGRVTCSTCSGAGTVSCDACGASGKTHVMGRVECSIQKELRVEADGGDEDRETIARRIPAEKLNDFAPMRLENSSRNGSGVTLSYSSKIPVESARVTIGRETAAIRAYGPAREVFHYHQLAEKLLTPDLSTLEASFKSGALAGAVRQFLEAEIHAVLARPASGADLPPEAARYVAKNLISETYARRAAGAIAKAAPELFGRLSWGRVKWFAGGTALAFVLARLPHLAGLNPYATLWTAALGAAGSWLAIEWTIRGKIKSSLGDAYYQHLAPALSSPSVKFRWMGIGTIGSIWFLTALPRMIQIHRATGSWAIAMGWNTNMGTVSAGAAAFALALYSAIAYAIFRISKRVGIPFWLTAVLCFLAIFPQLWVFIGGFLAYRWLKAKISARA